MSAVGKILVAPGLASIPHKDWSLQCTTATILASAKRLLHEPAGGDVRLRWFCYEQRAFLPEPCKRK